MKILMVCLGNICRSPMAQGALEHVAIQHGLNIEVDSAGTSGYHRGESPDDRAIACMRANGIDISLQKSRQIKAEDFRDFDIIFAMDRSNYKDLMSLCPDEALKSKIQLFRSYDENSLKQIVPDPYYGGLHEFENVYQLVIEASTYHVKHFLKH